MDGTDFVTQKRTLLDDLVIVKMEELPAELILNWDQTGIKLFPASSLVWSQHPHQQWKKRNKRVEVVDQVDNWDIFVGVYRETFYLST